MSIKIKELPELERPYEKLELYGEQNLSNAELDKNATRPGFLTAEIFDDNIVVVHYSFVNNKIEKKNEFKKVLVKK